MIIMYLSWIVIVAFIGLITGLSIGGTGGEVKELNELNDLQIPFPDGTYFVKTSDFGYRVHPITGEPNKFHSGVDLAPPPNTDIVASASGTVLETGYAPAGLGYYVYIEHEIKGKKYITAYGHMTAGSIVVSEGQNVQAKQKIGVAGSSGASTGIHLHFMLMDGKVCFVPECLLNPTFVIEKEENQNNWWTNG